jgi:2-polyprenyl-3-methyl-5-hydroxy-6-metoxy-1,4-benzoquinol methylase
VRPQLHAARPEQGGRYHRRAAIPSRYDRPVDSSAPNNAHAFALKMVGWNQRVLEIGAASGHVTRALAAQNCRVTAVECDPQAAADIADAADDVIVGDLNDPTTLAKLDATFDVALAGDVLEHLPHPQAVLDRMARLLVPGGRVVASLPNIGHVDVRLALMQGRFEYNSWGLLDQTHLRFFTLKTIREMVRRSGLAIIDMMRVRIPAFETELGVDRLAVATGLLETMLADPEAETYQFVFTAVRDDGSHQTARLAGLYQERHADYERLLVRSTSQAIENEALRRALQEAQARIEALTREREDACALATERAGELTDVKERLRRVHDDMAAELTVLRASRTLRYTRWPRDAYRSLVGKRR